MTAFEKSNDPSQSSGPLHSTLSSDPDMAELVQFFVEEMSERIGVIQTATQANDVSQLRTVAHQLKGAGAGYGFEPISRVAGELEKLIITTGESATVASFRSQVDELIDLCRRASV